jgi:hypothetical protein
MGDGNGGFQMGGGGNASSSSWGSFGNFNSDDNNIQATQGSGTFLRLESFAPQESASTGPPAGGIWDSNVLPYLSGGQTEALTAAAMYFQQQQMQQQQQQQQMQQQQPSKSIIQPQQTQGHEGIESSSPNRAHGFGGGSRGRGGHQKQRGRGGGGGGGGH